MHPPLRTGGAPEKAKAKSRFLGSSFSAKARLWLSSPRNDNFFRCATQKTPRASDKQRRSALGYNLGSSARSCADKANSVMRPQDPPLKTTLH